MVPLFTTCSHPFITVEVIDYKEMSISQVLVQKDTPPEKQLVQFKKWIEMAGLKLMR